MDTTRESINSIKAELGKGEVVCRTRQTGKTLALMEYIHEYCSGFCYVVACNPMEAERFQKSYHSMYPEDETPESMTFSNLKNISGRPRVWLSDEVWPDSVEKKNPEFERITYLGGVGTPMCMDMHS